MIDGFGINVLRQIPIEYISAIVSQIYSVHGGVIREAATGRIVAHLAIPEAGAALAGAVPGLGFVGDLAQTYQLHALSQNVQQVLSGVAGEYRPGRPGIGDFACRFRLPVPQT